MKFYDSNFENFYKNFSLLEQIESEPLFDFDEMIFTTCGRAGAHGPTVAECRNYYSGHSWTKDYFRMDKPGYQKFIIPRQGMYKFTVYGAGHTGSYRAYGAKVETVMYLHKMQEVELIVGQARVSDGPFVTSPFRGPRIMNVENPRKEWNSR